MTRLVGGDDVRRALGLRRDMEALAAEFTGHFRESGAVPLDPEPAIPRADPTVLFTNSAVVSFKPFIRGDRPLDDGLYTVTQPCVRAHNLKTAFAEAFSADFVLQFTMLGALAPAAGRATFTDAIARFFRDRLGLSSSQVLFKVASDDHDLHAGWLDTWSTPVSYDTERRAYYRWGFGDEGMTGRGATFAIAQHGGGWRDLGNLIAFEWQGRTVGYGFGIGVETLAACLARSRWVLDVMPPGVLPPVATEQDAKLADLAGMLVRLYGNGVELSSRAQGHVMRRALVSFDVLSGRLGVPGAELLARVAALAGVDQPDADVVGPLGRDLDLLHTSPESVRSLALSLRCRRDVHPETLCEAVERVSLPEVLRTEAWVTDIWTGPGFADDEHSVTLSLNLSTRRSMGPEQVRAALRVLTAELGASFGATLRGRL
ncbi:alanine--tRNA ligase-related protein [Nonomuraea sp. NBC_01738]|uniref:alanine--tRNA ligase-related protein n=1 Tax=Nonomuraea sp. NBC_01738 TaxID=2976003 RepID=UPI002E0D1FE4|nr:alanine--tRNA ligase-related protein [Nonomuraea sp. NBC_01738]